MTTALCAARPERPAVYAELMAQGLPAAWVAEELAALVLAHRSEMRAYVDALETWLALESAPHDEWLPWLLEYQSLDMLVPRGDVVQMELV
jgi:hypothetical protein